MAELGIVAIGRNEGDRLVRCLESVAGSNRPVVYVDSGSTDDSVAMARGKGVDVVELDMSIPFTMARGRNAGFRRLKEQHPDIDFVQFVDGDCEVVEGWLEKGLDAIKSEPKAAAVSGRRRERHPEVSIYNTLADAEWDTPIGWVDECHGDVMLRVSALDQVGLFNESMIAGEEPELCVRLRQADWGVLRIDAEMTRHDAAMTRFSQWWKRSVRGGHAFAELVTMHGATGNGGWTRQMLSQWAWAVVLPLALLVLAWPTGGWSLVGFAIYPLQLLKIAISSPRGGQSAKTRWLFAGSCVIGRWPQVLGQIRYWQRRLVKGPPQLIEYK
jgi:GT2 family glycosyltransferase